MSTKKLILASKNFLLVLLLTLAEGIRLDSKILGWCPEFYLSICQTLHTLWGMDTVIDRSKLGRKEVNAKKDYIIHRGIVTIHNNYISKFSESFLKISVDVVLVSLETEKWPTFI